MSPPALASASPDARPAAAAAPSRASERWLWVFVIGGVLLVLAAAAKDGQATAVLAAMVAVLVIVSYQSVLLAWKTMLGAILLIIVFVPIRRYTVAGNLPIELEPYRIVIALVFGCWFCAMAADPNVRWRKTGLEWPIGVLLVALLLSLAANLGRVNANVDLVVKNFTFFVSYIVLAYFITSVVRTRADVDRVVKVLVCGGAIVALASLVEWRTGANLFGWYGYVMPFLHYVDEGVAEARGMGVRARGTAQHPIALSAGLVMLVPLAIYLYQRSNQKLWLACAAVMTLGALSTGSRTGTTMLIALLICFLSFKWRETIRMLPMGLPLLVLIQIVMPGTLGTMRAILNPSYIIKEQSYDQGATAGRVADIGPALKRWSGQPVFGNGFGTTVADSSASKESDQQILDNQWLGSLLATGALGVAALLWLFVRAVRRLNRLAKDTTDSDSWLATALASSIVAFAIGMFTFDAFAFIQVTFFCFVMLGLAGVVTQRRTAAV